jgi:hypothetical protein
MRSDIPRLIFAPFFFVITFYVSQVTSASARITSAGITLQSPGQDSRGVLLDVQYRLFRQIRGTIGINTFSHRTAEADFRETGASAGLSTNPLKLFSGGVNLQSSRVSNDYQRSQAVAQLMLAYDQFSIELGGGLKSWNFAQEEVNQREVRKLLGRPVQIRGDWYATDYLSFAIFSEQTQFIQNDLDQLDARLLTDPSFNEFYSIVQKCWGAELTLSKNSFSMTIGGEKSLTLADAEEFETGIIQISLHATDDVTLRLSTTTERQSSLGIDFFF